MDKAKQRRLEKSGWKVGTAQEFLGLSDQESDLLEIKLALADSLKAKRNKLKMTQTELALALKSSQSRVAKLEAAESSVSIDLLIKAMLTLGLSRQDIGKIVGRKATA